MTVQEVQEVQEQAAALEQWLGTAVGEALQAALAVEEANGSAPAWQAVLARWSVAPLGEAERARLAQATGMRFGAPVGELHDVLKEIAAAAEPRLRAIDWPLDDAPLHRRAERLQRVVGELRESTLALYRQRVLPKRGMFAQAFAAAAKGPVGKGPPREALVMRCAACGAPRVREDHFRCDYCDSPFGGEGEAP
ncbi:MAG: hypothetical protein IPL40_07270 [Proteobacteria bacterium]|nr:hypothetical protein [Pseudomonadota bacterium]